MRNLNPDPNKNQRARVCERIRIKAADISRQRLNSPIDQQNNGESSYFNPPITTFTKSMHHNNYGLVNGNDFEVMIREINQDGTNGDESPFLGTYSTMKPAKFAIPLYDSSQHGNYHTGVDGPRTWESPLCGHIYELEGPDSDAVAMPPAPTLGSAELTAEMAEVYAMALCRDIPFEKIQDGSGEIKLQDEGGAETTVTVTQILAELNKLGWNNKSAGATGENLGTTLSTRQQARRQSNFGTGEQLDLKTLFRGSTPGANTGPYISQFFLIGTPDRDKKTDVGTRSLSTSSSPTIISNAQPRPARTSPPGFVRMLRSLESPTTPSPDTRNLRTDDTDQILPGSDRLSVKDGFIVYGQQLINQRILPQLNGKDYMADWASWIDVQNGANLKEKDEFGYKENGQNALSPFGRFIHSPRDLATFVHFDQLYQAYHNAMLILLGLGAGTDHGLPEGQGHPTRDAFATFGEPHILTLLPEVATRALKAVRRQKFQIHLRARPEALGGVLSLASHNDQVIKDKLGNALPKAENMLSELNGTDLPEWIKTHNAQIIAGLSDELKRKHNDSWLANADNLLLSQAFPEGSPVHGSYGAGHATVAGACTTILKAFFEMYAVDFDRASLPLNQMINMAPTDLFNNPLDVKELKGHDSKKYYVTDNSTEYPGSLLKEWDNPNGETLTIEGELDKLAANVSIGRNFGGVHYYTDYYESLRMGERIAVGMLQEQMLTYREPVSMRFTSFDGDKVMITGSGGSRGLDDALIHVWERGTGRYIGPNNIDEWWNRCLLEI